MRKTVSLFVLAILCSTQQEIHAQDGYFANWFDRVDKTRVEQPDWITPIATTTACLREGYRYDQVWQTNANGIAIDNYDGGKGLELIPFEMDWTPGLRQSVKRHCAVRCRSIVGRG